MNELQNIKSLIYDIHGRQVMLDEDLAKIYQVETRAVNQAVKRNIDRFPPEFMFQLSREEFENLKSQFVISSWGGRRKLPFAFTEHGVIMLSSVLKSNVAVQINVAVVKAFMDMRRYIANAEPVREELNNLKKVLMLHIDDTNNNFSNHTTAINKIIDALNSLTRTPQKPKRKLGFRHDE